MSKTVEINAPFTDGLHKITGKVAFFYVGEKRRKFLIQDCPHGSNEKFLTHYKSGMKLRSTSPVKFRGFKSYSRMAERQAAQLTLEEIISKHGADRVNAVIDSAETIN